MPRFSTLVVLTWRQPLASSVARSAAPRLEASSRPRYTRRAALTVGDSMIVDLSPRYVSPFGRGMSSNSLRTALVDVAQPPPRSRRASSEQRRRLSLFMAPSLAGAPRHGKRIRPALRQP